MSIISTKYLLQDAQANGYAVPAFNIHNAETIQAILEVCSEMRSPVILAGTPGTFKHIALEEIYALCSAYSTTYNMPLALHLDHHESLDDRVSGVLPMCSDCISANVWAYIRKQNACSTSIK